MLSKAIELNDTYNGVQVVVSTVETLEGNKIEDYAHAMYNQYDIGKYSMGILILVSPSDRDVRIEMGKKLQSRLKCTPASKEIQSKLLTCYLKTDDLAQGTVIAQSEIINEIKENVSSAWEKEDKKAENGMLICFIVVFGTGIIAIIYSLHEDRKY